MKTNDWIIIEEELHNGIWFSVSDGEVGKRAFSYDFRTREEALAKFKELKQKD